MGPRLARAGTPATRADVPRSAGTASNGAGGGGALGRVVGDASDLDGLDDAELAGRLGRGDVAAFTALYDRHAPAVHGLTRAVLRDDALAEEATHDVFLGLWQHPHAYVAARGSFGGWLLRVARNRAIDLLRRRREFPFPSGAAVSDGGWGEDRLIDPDPDPADQAASALVGQDVREALAGLGADQRRLLTMAFYEGLTQREIAERLGRPLGTVKSQIRAAMRHLAEVLAAEAPADLASATPPVVDLAVRERPGHPAAGEGRRDGD